MSLDPEKLADAVLEAIEPTIKALHDRISEIEKKGIEYKGVWQPPSEYTRGNLVTLSGSMWHCHVEKTQQRPGEGSDWQLAVKAGRDAQR